MQAPTAEKPKRRRGPTSEEHRARLREAQLKRWDSEPTTSTLPALLVRLQLVDARRAGASFEEAWPDAVANATRGLGRAGLGWVEALTQTRGAWERAYRHDEGQGCWSALQYSRI
jgi:hypothetical protein